MADFFEAIPFDVLGKGLWILFSKEDLFGGISKIISINYEWYLLIYLLVFCEADDCPFFEGDLSQLGEVSSPSSKPILSLSSQSRYSSLPKSSAANPSAMNLQQYPSKRRVLWNPNSSNLPLGPLIIPLPILFALESAFFRSSTPCCLTFLLGSLYS